MILVLDFLATAAGRRPETHAILPACLTGQESAHAIQTRLRKQSWILQQARLRVARIPPKVVRTPQASPLGDLVGLKGGKARAAILSSRRRAEIARRAAKARWKSDDD